MKKFIIIIFVLLAGYLVLSRGAAYTTAAERFAAWFRKSWLALTTGKSEA